MDETLIDVTIRPSLFPLILMGIVLSVFTLRSFSSAFSGEPIMFVIPFGMVLIIYAITMGFFNYEARCSLVFLDKLLQDKRENVSGNW